MYYLFPFFVYNFSDPVAGYQTLKVPTVYQSKTDCYKSALIVQENFVTKFDNKKHTMTFSCVKVDKDHGSNI